MDSFNEESLPIPSPHSDSDSSPDSNRDSTYISCTYNPLKNKSPKEEVAEGMFLANCRKYRSVKLTIS